MIRAGPSPAAYSTGSAKAKAGKLRHTGLQLNKHRWIEAKRCEH